MTANNDRVASQRGRAPFVSWFLCGLGLWAAVPPASAAGGAKLAIKAGKVWTKPGAPAIENGVVLIENGRITAVGGADTNVPWDAEVIDAPEWTAFPGYVEAHTWRGADRPNENIDVVPFLKISDSIDPVSFYFEDALRQGTTTLNVQQGNQTVIAGQGLIVRPVGLTVEELVVRTDAGIKLSATAKRGNSSATQIQSLRDTFGNLRRYLEDLVQQKKDGDDRSHREALFQGRELEGEAAKGRAMEGSAWKVEGLDRVPRGEIDPKQEPLLALVEGRMPAFFYCGRAMDVPHALEIARDNGFLARTTLVLDGDAWKAADRIAEAGVPVIWEGSLEYREADPIDGKIQRTVVLNEFEKHGLRYALSGEGGAPLGMQAALAVGLGLPREKALASVTTLPAEILGLGQRVGSLEAGRDGNVLLLSGDPLANATTVERVFIEGKPVYDRSKDIRIKHLLEGLTPPGTAPMGAEKVDPKKIHDDDHGAEEQDDGKKDEKDADKDDKEDDKDKKDGKHDKGQRGAQR